MPTYTFRVVTKQTGRRTRAAAREAYAAARDAWKTSDRKGSFPSHTLDECAWTAEVQFGDRIWADGGSCERIAVQRAVALALKAAGRR